MLKKIGLLEVVSVLAILAIILIGFVVILNSPKSGSVIGTLTQHNKYQVGYDTVTIRSGISNTTVCVPRSMFVEDLVGERVIAKYEKDWCRVNVEYILTGIEVLE